MQKNWYAVYTKPNCEKRVSGLLTKRGITNFYPLNKRRTQSFIRSKVFIEPLFKSYVFVHATESDIIAISEQTHYILSLLYWMGKPATINDSEIEAIRAFTQNHSE
ncbi:MAG: UpxY family transcription antiterminator, partial [Bacteroidota bacterium]|nr:UpxY family transcription antiterminator [Bacteroidota bacterium]